MMRFTHKTLLFAKPAQHFGQYYTYRYSTVTALYACAFCSLYLYTAPVCYRGRASTLSAMQRQEIIKRANQFMTEDFEVEASAILPAADLKQMLDLDSLDYIDLVVAIEQHFGFKIQPEDFQHLHTVNDFYDYIENRLAAKEAAGR